MPTLVNKTVKSAGGDYSSLSAWEAGQQGDLPGNDTIQQATVFPFNDTTIFTIDGWTTDATHYISIIADSTAYHNGFWDTSKYYLSATPPDSSALITILELFVRIDGIQLQNTLTSTINAAVLVGSLGAAGDVRVGHCLLKGVISGSSGIGIGIWGNDGALGACMITVYDSVAFDYFDTTFPNSLVALAFHNGFSDMRLYNCNTYNCNTGYSVNSTSFKTTAVNCLGYNHAANANYVDFAGGTFFQNSTNNASTDATAPGTSALINQTSGNVNFISTTSTNSNFLDLNSGSTLLAVGTNNPLSGIYLDDIRLRTRTGTWSIGANQPSAAPTGKLFRKSNLNGIGAGGPFFSDPLAA